MYVVVISRLNVRQGDRDSSGLVCTVTLQVDLLFTGAGTVFLDGAEMVYRRLPDTDREIGKRQYEERHSIADEEIIKLIEDTWVKKVFFIY